ncbi:hypothetical protein O6H91_09G054100 [Diphasiastrum complanatum]|uniref:Uncharacterized protein n=1 Tax=Diphasiastrum complanatum TaxID=34168 RepID=A0ACC2CQC2_DIPCM|nr:hypothetical protein O6H91_09G054100 [Diphasiastrum complanatum]
MVSCTRDTLLLDNIVSQLRHVRGICQSGALSSKGVEEATCLEPLQPVNDGFGNSLQRSKPLVEVILGGKRRKTSHSQSDGQLESWREPHAHIARQSMMNLLRE